MRTRALDDREYWTARQLRCAACGYMARHYEASWDARNAPEVLGVPYAGANGGLGREVSAPDAFRTEMRRANVGECTVYLSKCCDAPYLTTRLRTRLGSVAYRCRARDEDDTGCRLNAHGPEVPHLAGVETPDRRRERVWVVPTRKST